MTIFRFRKRLFGVLVLGVTGVPVIARDQQEDVTCSSIDPFVERACIGRRVEAKERRLTEIYPQALAAVRRNFARHGQEDDRSNPDYFVRSQTSWKQFVADDCKVQAAFGGGSNSSISDRETGCYEGALDDRIDFLEQLADGSFGAG